MQSRERQHKTTQHHTHTHTANSNKQIVICTQKHRKKKEKAEHAHTHTTIHKRTKQMEDNYHSLYRDKTGSELKNTTIKTKGNDVPTDKTMLHYKMLLQMNIKHRDDYGYLLMKGNHCLP